MSGLFPTRAPPPDVFTLLETRPYTVAIDEDPTVREHLSHEQGRALCILEANYLYVAPEAPGEPTRQVR